MLGCALIAMANVGCNQTLSIVWLCVAVALCAATYSVFQVQIPALWQAFNDYHFSTYKSSFACPKRVL